MKDFIYSIPKYSTELLLGLIIIYTILAFLAPLAFVTGFDKVGTGIQYLYRGACHQRVERSLFLFGDEKFAGFYTIEELQRRFVIPRENPYVLERFEEEIFGYPYLGNEDVGYKMAFCIRDTALYLSLVLTGLVIMLRIRETGKVKKFPIWLIIAFLLPMAVDGVFQTFAELLNWSWVPQAYIDNIAKRVITGWLFGTGFAMMVFPNMKEAAQMLYNDTIS